jgi:hypothetical protein
MSRCDNAREHVEDLEPQAKVAIFFHGDVLRKQRQRWVQEKCVANEYTEDEDDSPLATRQLEISRLPSEAMLESVTYLHMRRAYLNNVRPTQQASGVRAGHDRFPIVKVCRNTIWYVRSTTGAGITARTTSYR